MSFLCPFKILKKEKLYFSWLVFILIFGFANIIVELLMGEKESVQRAILGGQVYLFSLSVCTPFIAAFALDIIVKKKNKLESQCMIIKIVSILINSIFIFFNAILWVGIYKNSIMIQIIVLTVTIAFSLYMFCVQDLHNHSDILPLCIDKPYLEQERQGMDDTLKKSNSIGKETLIDGKDGVKL